MMQLDLFLNTFESTNCFKIPNMASTFDFSKDYILEDERVQLRALNSGDKQHLLPYSLQEPALWKYSLISAAGEDNLEKYISLALSARADKKEYPFIVYDKHYNNYAGSTRFYDMNLDWGTLQLGFTWYGGAYHGTGLNKHCKFLLLQFAFEQMGMVRVEFRADNKNEKSIAAMKSIGCKVDGVLRQNMPTRDSDVRRDSIVLSILRDEWFSEVKENLQKKISNIQR
jgi:RimJ/RimL family protein N-acetyltransferase